MSTTLSTEELAALAEMNISDTEEEDDPTALKRLGNDAFHTKDFLKAIRLYTLALQNLPESDAPAVGKEINKGVTAPKSGKQYQKEQLIRAVDARGLIIRLDDRLNFPYPPEELLQGRSADMLDPVLTLVRRRGTQAPSDMRLAPIAYHVLIVAPYFKAHPSQGNKPYSIRASDLVYDDAPISSFISNLFSSIMLNFPSNLVSDAEYRQYMHTALAHDDPRDSVIMALSSRGRMPIVPRSATLKQIIAGTRWPRDGPLPFEDKRQRPRRRDDPVDGIELSWGGFINLYVIPKEKLAYHVQFIESGHKLVGLQ
ncbi:hypothetical protein SCP_0500660 [Sparassis crispa]|uniref:Tetratricopeptide repeat protein n=1 Tax=Sparassis crispa TaxID=139825 RepID=A0A401GLG5_9APHY|nr:hypothetical protein SCP_0500660 [Sparassis crispa]GBE83023.1 hypothetical protein SCP_0500660 [Sparassis crispa]